MKQQWSILILRLAIVFIGLPVIALCIFVLPKVAIESIEQAQSGAVLGYVVISILIIMYLSAIPFYTVLYQALKLLSYIEKNEAFQDRSVNSLRIIRNCSVVVSVLYMIALPMIYIIAQWDDAPGLIVIGLIIAGASMIIAVFAAVLKKLLQQAIDIKTENDLTV